jgi:two-component system, NarL family, nitrate/nitrite response regulator NarL
MHTSNAKTIGVLLIDDHVVVRAGLRMFLENQPGITVVGEAANPDDALALAIREHPDIVLLDLDLGDANGLDLLPQLRTTVPEAHVVVLTGIRDPEIHRRAVHLGAMGLVPKETAPDVLLRAITTVHAGGAWLDSILVASILGEMTRTGTGSSADPEALKIATLTAREREVVDLVGQGLKNQAIADRLCISEATVRHHLTSIFAKLGVIDRLKLTIYAYQHGLACVTPYRRPITFPPPGCSHLTVAPPHPHTLRKARPGV